MERIVHIFVLIAAYTVGIFENDCTFAVVLTMILSPAIFERKEKRKYVNKFN